MFSYAPIWTNKLLVNLITLLVGLSFFICFIAIIWLIYSFVEFMLYKRDKGMSLTELTNSIDFRIITSGLVISCVILGLFYLPQKVIPDRYIIDQLRIEEVSFKSEGKRIKIVDKEKIDELIEIFSGYNCKRSLDSSEGMETGDISITLFGTDKGIRKHFDIVVRQQGYFYRYTGMNVDFIYKFIDSNESCLWQNKIVALRK